MTPTDQEFLHCPEAGIQGDCQRAVIASLLDLPLSEVPHFLAVSTDVDEYYTALQRFLGERGYIMATVRAGPVTAFGDAGDVFHEIAGPSPRGNGSWHAVVGRNGQVFFDPHPSRAGLGGDPSEWQHSFLVRSGEIKALVP